MLGKIEGRRRRGQQRMRWADGITNFNGHEIEQAPGGSGGQRSHGVTWGHMGSHGVTKGQT